MNKKLSVKSIIIFILIAVVLVYLYQSSAQPMKSSMYNMKSGYETQSAVVGVESTDMGEMESGMYAPADLSGSINLDIGCSMQAGTGLSSSLMPHEVASQEDYAQFAPNDILKGQNFLDPRQQVGWPETIGGTIRNGNHDLRADPPNPKDSYVWNNSTIVPDLMQRNLFCN